MFEGVAAGRRPAVIGSGADVRVAGRGPTMGVGGDGGVRHQMRAEYETPEDGGEPTDREPGAVRSWHMVRGEETVAMCGRELDPEAATRPDEEWGRTAEPFCHTCGALYLREVP